MYAGRFNNSFINYSCVGLADITHFAIDWLMMYYILSAVAESSSSAAQGWHGIHCRGKRSGTLIECGADWSPHCLCSPPHPTFRFHLPPPPLHTHLFSISSLSAFLAPYLPSPPLPLPFQSKLKTSKLMILYCAKSKTKLVDFISTYPNASHWLHFCLS